MYDLKEIGKRLRQIRKELNLKQKLFSKNLSVSHTTLSDYETGKKKPGFEFMFNLSNKYNVNLNYLLHGKGERFVEKIFDHARLKRDKVFGDYHDDVLEMIWLMEQSRLALSAIMTFAKEYLYRNESLIEKDIAVIASNKRKHQEVNDEP